MIAPRHENNRHVAGMDYDGPLAACQEGNSNKMVPHHPLLASTLSLVAALVFAPGGAQAQSSAPNVSFRSPATMPPPRGYSQVVEVNTPGRMLFIAGQLGYDASGKQGQDFRAQATLVFENLKAAVESAGGHMSDLVKINGYLTDIRVQLPILVEVRDKYVNTAAPPASTMLEIQKLAREGALLEIEAVAVLPAK